MPDLLQGLSQVAVARRDDRRDGHDMRVVLVPDPRHGRDPSDHAEHGHIVKPLFKPECEANLH